MRHICYTSLAPAMDQRMFESVMEAACRRNRDRDICGIIAFRDGVVTQIVEAAEFWAAEDYHQEYWEGDGQRNPYCMATIPPKLAKLRKSFASRSKTTAE